MKPSCTSYLTKYCFLLACALFMSKDMQAQTAIANAVANHLLIMFEQGTPSTEIDSLRIEYQAVEIGFTARTNAYLWLVPDTIILGGKQLIGIEQREHAKKETAVEDADLNWLTKSISSFGGSNPVLPNSNCIGYPNQWYRTKMKLDEASGLVVNGSNSGVVVAVLDTGVDIFHPDLSAYIWNNEGEIPNDGVDNDGNGFTDDTQGFNFVHRNSILLDDHTHGTHVAGLIKNAAKAVNPRLMPLKTQDCEGGGNLFDLVSAIDYAVENGASIINMSLGYYGESSPILSKAIELGLINNEDVLFVCSSGNNQLNNDLYSHFPSGFSHLNIIAVAASDLADELCPFSDYGPYSVDVAAPGTCIISSYPSYSIEQQSTDQDPFDNPGTVCGQLGPIGTGDYYGSKEGASMAAALVSGTAALLKGEHPSLAYYENRAALFCNVDTLSNLLGVIGTGGRINAYEAMLNAGNICGHFTIKNRLPAAVEMKGQATALVYASQARLFFKMESATKETIVIRLFSIDGQQQASFKQEVQEGQNQFSWNILRDMAKGVYIYQIIAKKQQLSGKFLMK